MVDKMTKDEIAVKKEREEIEPCMEAERSSIYSRESSTLDLSKRLATDTKSNRMITLPRERPNSEESELAV